MLSKNEAKYIQSLGHKKYRREEGVFVAEGPKIVSELVSIVPKQFQKIYAVESWAKENSSLTGNVQIEIVTGKELERISGLKTPNEVVAVIKQFESNEPANFSFTLYLDNVQDPGNFGTIIRIADWFGVKDVVCSEGCADLYNSKVVQSTMASIARVNVYYEEDNWLAKQDCVKLAATLGGQSLNDFTPSDKTILVIGNESKGISDEVMKQCTHQITIPKKGQAESLNAAVATGILLSHLINL
jgi:RNA methyltransferase, TrmH family